MRNIFIFHGSNGNPNENWFPWLKIELKKIGARVFVPQFPIPSKPKPCYGGHNLDQWLAAFEKYRKYISDKTIIVAHSRGCVFAYHLLASFKKPIAATYFVAPWTVFRWYPKGWNKTDSFHKSPLNWSKIKNGAKYFEVYQSTNDDTPVAEGKNLAAKLGAKLIIVKNAGHFNVAYDKKFKKFPLILENIRSRL